MFSYMFQSWSLSLSLSLYIYIYFFFLNFTIKSYIILAAPAWRHVFVRVPLRPGSWLYIYTEICDSMYIPRGFQGFWG